MKLQKVISEGRANVLAQAKRKAKQSPCRYQVVAIGIDERGNPLGCCNNQPRLDKHHGGLHAEMHLLNTFGRLVKTIILLRPNRTGVYLRIHPCFACAKVLRRMKIKVFYLESVGGLPILYRCNLNGGEV